MSQRKYIKTWSYRQVTVAAENSLRIEMDLAGKYEEGSILRYVHECRAAGILAAWSALTMGWQQPADARRLEHMARISAAKPCQLSEGA